MKDVVILTSWWVEWVIPLGIHRRILFGKTFLVGHKLKILLFLLILKLVLIDKNQQI